MASLGQQMKIMASDASMVVLKEPDIGYWRSGMPCKGCDRRRWWPTISPAR
jgi:hypothetical protein